MANGALSLFSFLYALVVLVLFDLDYTFSLLTLFDCQGVIALDIDWLLTAFPGAVSLLIKSNFDSSFILGSTSCVEADAQVDCNIGKEDDDGPILFKTFLYHRHDTL
jgi:hypothetical protein